jgi:glucarate dehydratase
VKISELRITPIALGDPPLLNASGLHAPYALRLVIQLAAEDGTVGLSEVPGGVAIENGFRAVRDTVVGRRAEAAGSLLAAVSDVLGRGGPEQRGEASWDQRVTAHVRSGIEMACLDLVARQWGCRVVDLLGGPRRESVPFCGYLFFKHRGTGGDRASEGEAVGQAGGWAAARGAEALTPAGVVAQAEAMVAEFGFGSLKLKAGILDPRVEVESIEALHEAFGGRLPLRFDPNAVWTYDTALAWGRRMKGKIEYYEDPVRGQAAMARLRADLGIPLATNMCTTDFDELRRSVGVGSEDVILSDLHFWGGFRECLHLARMCAVFGRGFSMHSNSHAGISLAAMTQLGAVVPNLDYALDTHYPWQADEIIRGGKLPIQDGCVQLPDGPGLGVELDETALGAAHQKYVDCGLRHRDDEAEMQKRDPGWRFLPERY